MLVSNTFLSGLTEDALVAACGALLAYAANKLIAFIQDTREQLHFPVAGQYITEHEDDTANGVASFFAEATLKQVGLKVTGTTNMDDRTWILDGTIDPTGGYLSGIYRANNPYDKGVGNFFLEIRPDGTLAGLWSGYDSENRFSRGALGPQASPSSGVCPRMECAKTSLPLRGNRTIHAGKYRFRKILPLQVTPITKHTVGPALAIAEKQLGDSYIQAGDFLDSKNISLCAICRGTVAGFLIAKALSVEDFRTLYPNIEETLRRQISYAKTVGFIASMATAPEFEKRGVAHALLEAGLACLEKAGQPLICTIGWKGKGAVAHIDGLVRKAGFQAVHEFADYWKEDSLEKGYRCPVCGDPPCRCSAVLFCTPYACG